MVGNGSKHVNLSLIHNPPQLTRSQNYELYEYNIVLHDTPIQFFHFLSYDHNSVTQ